MTTGGEGGMITTRDKTLWAKVWALKDHGKAWDAVYERQHAPGFRWLHESFGTNWRMLETQAAIGRIQLRRMEQWQAKRLEHATRIWNAARNIPGLRVPSLPPSIRHAAYRCYVFVTPDQLNPGWNQLRALDEITARGVPCYSGSCAEIYLEKAFEKTSWRPHERLPVSKELGETSLAFLVHPTLSDMEIDKTCRVLAETSTLSSRLVA